MFNENTQFWWSWGEKVHSFRAAASQVDTKYAWKARISWKNAERVLYYPQNLCLIVSSVS